MYNYVYLNGRISLYVLTGNRFRRLGTNLTGTTPEKKKKTQKPYSHTRTHRYRVYSHHTARRRRHDGRGRRHHSQQRSHFARILII